MTIYVAETALAFILDHEFPCNDSLKACLSVFFDPNLASDALDVKC